MPVAKPWLPGEAVTLQKNARHVFRRHNHDDGSKDTDELDSCAACALQGRRELSEQDGRGPNYAGWGRLFVEAQQPIPRRWQQAFVRELTDKNQLYTEALLRSIATFGYPIFADDVN